MTFWQVWKFVALADAAVAAIILLRDGAKENTVWWVFLIIPMFLGIAAAGRFLFNLVFE